MQITGNAESGCSLAKWCPQKRYMHPAPVSMPHWTCDLTGKCVSEDVMKTRAAGTRLGLSDDKHPLTRREEKAGCWGEAMWRGQRLEWGCLRPGTAGRPAAGQPCRVSPPRLQKESAPPTPGVGLSGLWSRETVRFCCWNLLEQLQRLTLAIRSLDHGTVEVRHASLT